jgi:hypothetical protein
VKFRLDESQFHRLFWSIAVKEVQIAKVAGGKCWQVSKMNVRTKKQYLHTKVIG